MISDSLINLMKFAKEHDIVLCISCEQSLKVYRVDMYKDGYSVDFYASYEQAVYGPTLIEKLFYEHLADLNIACKKKTSNQPEESKQNTCICCGEPIPEGRQVCPGCEGNEEALT